MAIQEIKVLKCTCERCRHEWITRSIDKPRVCPKCKSPYWDIPRKKPNRKSSQNNTCFMNLNPRNNFIIYFKVVSNFIYGTFVFDNLYGGAKEKNRFVSKVKRRAFS